MDQRNLNKSDQYYYLQYDDQRDILHCLQLHANYNAAKNCEKIDQ